MSFRDMCHKSDKLLQSIVTYDEQEEPAEDLLMVDKEVAAQEEEIVIQESSVEIVEVLSTQANEEIDAIEQESIDQQSEIHLQPHQQLQQDDGDECSVMHMGGVTWSDLECYVPVTCPLCNLSEESWTEAFHSHLQCHLQTDLYCAKCQDHWDSAESLVRHFYEHIDEIFPCPRCDSSFAYPPDLLEHARTECFKVIILEEELQFGSAEEEEVEAPPEPHTRVEIAPRKKANATTNKRPRDEDTGPRGCEFCGKVLKDLPNYERHRMRHTSDRKYKCNECDATFVYARELSLHAPYHDTANHNFICYECDPPKKYYFKRSLKTHMARNHKPRQRDQVCPECGKTFYDQTALKKHSLVHMDVKRYVCEVCSQRFTRGDHLRTHMKTHQRRQAMD